MDLLSKFNELHKTGQPLKEVVENIFLNYNAYTNNDDIYVIKKQIAKEFNVEINNVKLIGSSHTGFKNFEPREEAKDYDFAIIDPFLFRDYLLKIDINELSNKKRYEYTNNISKGKMHILYASTQIKIEIKNKLEKIKVELKNNCNITINKSMSVCFYISEQAFIKGLCNFFTIEISKSMPKIEMVEKDMSIIKKLEKIY